MHLIKSEIQEIYLNLVIQQFAFSLIALFIPIYLIQLGYSITQTLFFVMVLYSSLALFSPVSAILAKKYGFKHLIIYRMPFTVLFLVMLYLLQNISLPIYLIALIGGTSTSVYWTSLHALFAKYSDKIHRGSQTGKLVSMPGLAALLGPSIGGIIAITAGFHLLFGIAILIFVLSVIPLFFTGDMKPHVVHFSFKELFRRNHIKFTLGFAAQGFMFIGASIMWPLFVFFVLKDVASVGFMGTITALGAIMFTLYIGKVSDRMNKFSIIRIGGLLAALTFFLRIYALDTVTVLAVSFAAGIFLAMIEVPFTAEFYNLTNERNRAKIVVLREVGINLGKVASLAVLLWVVNKFAVGFSLGGIAALIFSIF